MKITSAVLLLIFSLATISSASSTKCFNQIDAAQSAIFELHSLVADNDYFGAFKSLGSLASTATNMKEACVNSTELEIRY